MTCATAGNHGRSVAWGARRAGLRCVLYIHQAVSAEREAALRALGAEVVRTPGSYDDAVRAPRATRPPTAGTSSPTRPIPATTASRATSCKATR